MSRIDFAGFGQNPKSQIVSSEAVDPFACSEEESETPIESTPGWRLSFGYEKQVCPIEPCIVILDSFRGTSNHIKVMMNGGNLASALKKSTQYPPEVVNSVTKLATILQNQKMRDSKTTTDAEKKELQLLVQECGIVCKKFGYTFNQTLLTEVLAQQQNAKQASVEANVTPDLNRSQSSAAYASSSEPATPKQRGQQPSGNLQQQLNSQIEPLGMEGGFTKKKDNTDVLASVLESVAPAPAANLPQAPVMMGQQQTLPMGQQMFPTLPQMQQQFMFQQYQEIQRQMRMMPNANPQLFYMFYQQQMLQMQAASSHMQSAQAQLQTIPPIAAPTTSILQQAAAVKPSEESIPQATVVSSEDIDSSPDEALKEKHYRHYTEMKRSGKSKKEIKRVIQDKERIKMLNKNLAAGGNGRKDAGKQSKNSKFEEDEKNMVEIQAPDNFMEKSKTAKEDDQPPLPHPALTPEEQAAKAAEETHRVWMRQHLHPVPIWKRDSSKFVKERFREHIREIERESVAKRRARIETREITLLSTKVRYSHQIEFKDSETKEMREISVHLPFIPDNQQTRILDDLVTALNKQTQIALESVAGCGRSILLMAASLAWLKAKQERRRHSDSKIFFVVENESDIKFAIKELESLPYSPKYTILSDRDRQCTNKSLRYLQGNYKEVACVNLNKSILTSNGYKLSNNPDSKPSCICPHLDSLHSAGSLPQDRASFLPDLESLWEDQDDDRTSRFSPCAYYHSRAALSAAHIVFLPFSLIGSSLGLSGASVSPPSPSTTYGFLSTKGEKTQQFPLWNPFQQPSSFLSFPPPPQASPLLTSATIPPSIFSASIFLLLPSSPNTISAPSPNQPPSLTANSRKPLKFEIPTPTQQSNTAYKPQFQLLPPSTLPARRCHPWSLSPNLTCTSISNLVLPLQLLQRLGHTPIERVAHNLLVILRTKSSDMPAQQLFEILTMAVGGGIRLRHPDTGLPECADDEQNGFEYTLDPSQNSGEGFDHLAPVNTDTMFGTVGAMDKLVRLINSAEEMLLEKFQTNDIHTLYEHMEQIVTLSQWVRWLDRVKDLYFEHTNATSPEQELQHFRLLLEQKPDLQMKESVSLILECQTPRVFFKNLKRVNPGSIVISSPSLTPFEELAAELNMPNMLRSRSGVPDALRNTENIHVAILNNISREGPQNRISGPELISIITAANPSKDRAVLVLFPSSEQLFDWVSANVQNLSKLQLDTKGCIYVEGTWELPHPSLDDGKKISLEQVAEALSKMDKLLKTGDNKPAETKPTPQLMPFVNSSVSLNAQGCSVIFAVLGGMVCQHRRRSYNSPVAGVRLIIMAGRVELDDFTNSSPTLTRKEQYIENQMQKGNKKESYADWVRATASKTLNETMGLLNRKRDMAALVLIGQEYNDDLRTTKAFRPWYRSAYNIYNDTQVLLNPLREFFEGKRIPNNTTTTKLKQLDMLEREPEEKSIRMRPEKSSRLVRHHDKSESPHFPTTNMKIKRLSNSKDKKLPQSAHYQKYPNDTSERSVQKTSINQRKFGVFNDNDEQSESTDHFAKKQINVNSIYEPSKKNVKKSGSKSSPQGKGAAERNKQTSSEVQSSLKNDFLSNWQEKYKELGLSSSLEGSEASATPAPVLNPLLQIEKPVKSHYEVVSEKFCVGTSSVGSQFGTRKEHSETREDTLEIIDEMEEGRAQRLTDYLGKRRLNWDHSPSETSNKQPAQGASRPAKVETPNVITVQQVKDPLGIGVGEEESSDLDSSMNRLAQKVVKPNRTEGRLGKSGSDGPLRPKAMFQDSNDSGEASYLKSTKSDTRRYQNSTTSQTAPREQKETKGQSSGEQRGYRLTSRHKWSRVEQLEPQEPKVSTAGYKGFAKEYRR